MSSKWIKDQKLRDKSVSELSEMVTEMKSSLFTARFQQSTGKLDNFQLLRQNKRRLAVLMTLIREKELESQAMEGNS